MSSSIDKVEELITWAKDGGAYLHEKVEIYDDEQYGIALKVRGNSSRRAQKTENGDLPAKSRIVSCPFTLSLSWLNALDVYPALRSHSSRLPSEILTDAPAQVIGNFFLMQQYLLGEISHWHKYIQSLPQPNEHEKLGTPLYFTPDDLKWIKGTNLELARKQRRQKWESEWDQGVSILNKHEPFADLKRKWTFDLYIWAATIFSSRSFISNLIPKEVLELPTSLAEGNVERTNLFQSNAPSQRARFFKDPFPVLFPLVDLANHSSAARVTWFSNAHEDHNAPRDLSIIIDSDIPQGYGFCLPDNDEVEIQFLPFNDDRTNLRKTEQTMFTVRQKPYHRSERLPEFTMFEDGLVDTMALCVVNQRELSFFRNSPEYQLETSAETIFTAGPLARNAFHAISALQDRLEILLSRILSNGEHLGIPANPKQRAAKMYREGQIKTLQLAMDPLEKRLRASMLPPKGKRNKYTNMQESVRLCTLQMVFDWLANHYPHLWDLTNSALCVELEAESVNELISSEWEFVSWCTVIYIATALHFFGKSKAPTDDLTVWMKNLLQTYSDDLVPDFEAGPFQLFRGELDELGTLEAIIDRMALLNGADFNASSVVEMGDVKTVNQRLMAFSSTIAIEECFPVRVETSYTSGSVDRNHQRVLCLLKDGSTKVKPSGTVTVVEKGKWVEGATPEAVKEMIVNSGRHGSNADDGNSPWPTVPKEDIPELYEVIPPLSPIHTSFDAGPSVPSGRRSAVYSVEEYLLSTDDEISQVDLLALSSRLSPPFPSSQLPIRATSCRKTASAEAIVGEEDILFGYASLGSIATSAESDEEFPIRGRDTGSQLHRCLRRSVTPWPERLEQEGASQREISPLKRQIVDEDSSDGYDRDTMGSPKKRAKSSAAGTSFVVQDYGQDLPPTYEEHEKLSISGVQ